MENDIFMDKIPNPRASRKSGAVGNPGFQNIQIVKNPSCSHKSNIEGQDDIIAPCENPQRLQRLYSLAQH